MSHLKPWGPDVCQKFSEKRQYAPPPQHFCCEICLFTPCGINQGFSTLALLAFVPDNSLLRGLPCPSQAVQHLGFCLLLAVAPLSWDILDVFRHCSVLEGAGRATLPSQRSTVVLKLCKQPHSSSGQVIFFPPNDFPATLTPSSNNTLWFPETLGFGISGE